MEAVYRVNVIYLALMNERRGIDGTSCSVGDCMMLHIDGRRIAGLKAGTNIVEVEVRYGAYIADGQE